jgi:hypothetical protein
VSVRAVVADGVVDEVGDQAFDQSGIPDGRRGCEVLGQVDAFPDGSVTAGGEHAGDDLREIDRVPAGGPVLAGGQGEQGVDEPFLMSAQGAAAVAA